MKKNNKEEATKLFGDRFLQSREINSFVGLTSPRASRKDLGYNIFPLNTELVVDQNCNGTEGHMHIQLRSTQRILGCYFVGGELYISDNLVREGASMGVSSARLVIEKAMLTNKIFRVDLFEDFYRGDYLVLDEVVGPSIIIINLSTIAYKFNNLTIRSDEKILYGTKIVGHPHYDDFGLVPFFAFSISIKNKDGEKFDKSYFEKNKFREDFMTTCWNKIHAWEPYLQKIAWAENECTTGGHGGGTDYKKVEKLLGERILSLYSVG